MECTSNPELHFQLKYMFPSAGNKWNLEFCLAEKIWNVYHVYLPGLDLDTEQQTQKIHCYIALVNNNSIQIEGIFTLFNDTVSTVVPVI